MLGDAVDLLREAGHGTVADEISTDLVGRNVIEGRWSFQLVEEYDATYYDVFKRHERTTREALADGRSHLFEAEMKQARRSHGRRHHEATPED